MAQIFTICMRQVWCWEKPPKLKFRVWPFGFGSVFKNRNQSEIRFPHITTLYITHRVAFGQNVNQKKYQRYRIVLSELPETTRRSRYCRHAMPRLCPFSVRINSLVTVLHTLIVRSPDADTMYLSSKSTTLTAARWPTRTRRNVMSIADCMSHTAIERSCTYSRTIKVTSDNFTMSYYQQCSAVVHFHYYVLRIGEVFATLVHCLPLLTGIP